MIRIAINNGTYLINGESIFGESKICSVNFKITESILSDDYVSHIRKSIKDCTTSNDPAYYGANEEALEDHGTANLAVLAENGDAVVATSTINLQYVLSKNSKFITSSQ